jgi:hypothetical protein
MGEKKGTGEMKPALIGSGTGSLWFLCFAHVRTLLQSSVYKCSLKHGQSTLRNEKTTYSTWRTLSVCVYPRMSTVERPVLTSLRRTLYFARRVST